MNVNESHLEKYNAYWTNIRSSKDLKKKLRIIKVIHKMETVMDKINY